MDTWDAIRARRNVRSYTDQPIPREDLERILEAGRRAPSAGNRQPWNFVVVTDREQLRELAKVWDPGGGTSRSQPPPSPSSPRNRRMPAAGTTSSTTSGRRRRT